MSLVGFPICRQQAIEIEAGRASVGAVGLASLYALKLHTELLHKPNRFHDIYGFCKNFMGMQIAERMIEHGFAGFGCVPPAANSAG